MGQEIPSHPENYDAVFFVLKGEGVFTIGEEKLTLKEGSMIFSSKEKVRGIRSLKRLSILGIRERVKDGKSEVN
ncbi:cupin domain-containing protein [Candidatus Bathyarchaeota archaeon]|nr:cupin domain-containing protein [Candidatus Bathyarchaeota archaeon]